MPEAADALRRLEGLSPRGMKLGLEAIRELLRRLGDPQGRVPRVLVGGTNGKGSTAATLSAILHAAGVRCGLHTSPHLEDVCERIRIAERTVSPDALSGALERVFRAAEEAPPLPITYFEAVTAAAEVLFEDEQCEFAVVEVGLGGRLDATNASEPVLSVLTSVALDHQADLGDTVRAIAREKAGIFRRGAFALSGVRDEEARRVLREESRRVGAVWVDASDPDIRSPESGDFGESFTLETGRARYRLTTPLCGAHQRRNVALAVAAAELLGGRLPRLTREAVEHGTSRTRWPGRLEAFPAAGTTVWLDGCHNPAGAKALGEFLAARSLSYDLLFGVMADKDIEGIAREIVPAARRVVLAAPKVARAASPGEIRSRLSAMRADLESAESTESGLARLLASPAEAVVVAGSLYLVGEARPLLRGGQDRRAIA